MDSHIKRYAGTVRKSSDENEKAIKLLYYNRLYKKVVGTLREELELYARTLYLLNKSNAERDVLLNDFIQNRQWENENRKRLTDREMLDCKSDITGFGWEKISYKFACCFIHLSILHNWDEEDITVIVDTEEKREIVKYINHYHCAALNSQSSFKYYEIFTRCF